MSDYFVILGDPVEHSLSPVIQQAALDFAGIDGVYGARRVDDIGMAQASDELRQGSLSGANVTMPHKRMAAQLADDLLGDAGRMRAANTLWGDDGRLIAASTDPDGVRFAWNYAVLPSDAPILVLGAGGAASAALVALSGRALAISARRDEAARGLLSTVRSDATVLPWGTGLSGAVLVNATPIGMGGGVLPGGVVDAAVGMLEMTYGAESKAQQTLAGRGFPVASGEMMLVGQAVASFRHWTGVEVPHSVMFDAIAAAESGR